MAPRRRVPLLVERPRASHYRKMNKIADDLGTAVNVQAMVFGNMGDTSATGVGFTRNPATGEKEFYGEFLINAQGEDVVAGIRTPHADLRARRRACPRSTSSSATSPRMLEKHYHDMQDFEFTIQEGKLYMLQTRNGKRTGPAAVQHRRGHGGGRPDRQEGSRAPRRPAAARPAAAPGARSRPRRRSCTKLATGLPASPGAAVGQIVFTADDAVEAGQEGAGHPGPQRDRARTTSTAWKRPRAF